MQLCGSACVLLFHDILARWFYGHLLKCVTPVVALSRALVEETALRGKIACLLIHCLQGEGLCSVRACAKTVATPDPFLPCSTLTKSVKDLGSVRLFQCGLQECLLIRGWLFPSLPVWSLSRGEYRVSMSCMPLGGCKCSSPSTGLLAGDGGGLGTKAQVVV